MADETWTSRAGPVAPPEPSDTEDHRPHVPAGPPTGPNVAATDGSSFASSPRPTAAPVAYPSAPPVAEPPPEPQPRWREPDPDPTRPGWLRDAPTPDRATGTGPVVGPHPGSVGSQGAPWFPTRPPGGPSDGPPVAGGPSPVGQPYRPVTDVSAPHTPSSQRRPAMAVLLVAVAMAALVSSVVTAGIMALAGGDRVIERVVQSPLQLEGGGLNIGALLAKAQPSVVSIRTGGASVGGVFGGAGSGVIISDDGLVLTNAHVMGSNASAEVTLFDGSVRQAILVGSSRSDDIALIAMVDPPAVTPAELGVSADVRVGDSVVAIGNALNLGGTPSVTLGIVSAKDREIQAPGNIVLRNLIQTDAAINPGNSGGPLLNALGQVVGINTAIISDAQSIGFAIAIDAVKPLIDEIKAEGGDLAPDDAFLGVSMVAVEDLLAATRREYGVTVDQGVFITEVVPGSAASSAGFELGDVLVEVDGQSVRSPSDVANIIRSRSPGDSLRLRLIRDGEEIEITAVLGTRGG